MVKINVKAVRIIAIILVLISIAAFALFQLWGYQRKHERTVTPVEPALAPTEVVFSSKIFKDAEDSNIAYTLTKDGQFILKDKATGAQYLVTNTGTVFEIDEQDNLAPVTDIIKDIVLANTSDIVKQDDTVATFFGDILPTAITPDEVPIVDTPSQKTNMLKPSDGVLATNQMYDAFSVAPKEQSPITATIPGIVKPAASSPIPSSMYAPGGYQAPSYDSAALAAAISSQTVKSSYDQQNAQAAKQDFVQTYSALPVGSTQLTPNDLAAGTIINMTLITGLNSDLPGQIVAQVAHNVYDTLTGNSLLIPKGTRLIATYDSSVSWGQSRALVAWTQLIRPDGLVLTLPGLPGIDAAGYAGYQDKVNNHVWSMIGAAFLASLIDLGADEVVIQADNAGIESAGLNAVGDFTTTLQSAGQKWLNKVIDRQPTLRIRPGRKINLLVTQTLTFTPYKER